MKKQEQPRIEASLVEFLQKKCPQIEYKQGCNVESFLHDAIFRAGQRNVVAILERMLKQQERR